LPTGFRVTEPLNPLVKSSVMSPSSEEYEQSAVQVLKIADDWRRKGETRRELTALSGALDQLLVLGTLLEGHADHVMDAVGPKVVPSVATIRRRFDERRQRKQPPLQRVMRALLGFDAKLSQYTRGKAFVDYVVSRVGMERFNTVWSSPETLPLPTEIDEPQRWIDRVL